MRARKVPEFLSVISDKGCLICRRQHAAPQQELLQRKNSLFEAPEMS
jgi:hypothetical protein